MLNIVLYEGDYLMRNLLREWLGEAGYRVAFGAPCGAAVDSRADLVILSVYMPKQIGQCIRDIRAAHPATPLIAISGQFPSGRATAGTIARTLGVDKVIAKPLVRGDLLAAVRDTIGPGN
jgi:DNA-binding response OmpR family regulator